MSWMAELRIYDPFKWELRNAAVTQNIKSIIKAFTTVIVKHTSVWPWLKVLSFQERGFLTANSMRCRRGRERSEVRIYCGKIQLTSSMVDNYPGPSGILHISSTSSRAQTQFTSPLHHKFCSLISMSNSSPEGEQGSQRLFVRCLQQEKRVGFCLFWGLQHLLLFFFPCWICFLSNWQK